MVKKDCSLALRKYLMLLDKYSIHSWIQNNGIKTESGQLIDFHNHRFLFDIYRDNSKYIVCEKAAQIGFTTFEILNSFWKAYNQGLDIIYVLPTATDVKDFAGGKVNRIIDQNPILQEWVKDKDSVEQKRVGKATIYYRGSWSDRAALMISADWLILDEYDRSKQEILEMYESRLQHSKHGKKSIFSNPSKPDYGVNKWYKQSDEKRLYIKHSCGEIYELDESCVDYKDEVYRCPTCKKEISDECRRMAEWVDKDGYAWTGELREGYEWSGYRIPLWAWCEVPAKRIAEYKRTKTPEFFANFVAGMPYLNTNDMLSQQILESNLLNKINAQEGRIIIGVDTGHNIHYTLANKDGLFYHGYCPSIAENPTPGYDPYDELDKLMTRFPRAIMIADQGGDLIGIRKLQAKYRGRVYLCWFTKETKTQQIIRWGQNDEEGKVLVDRNRAIQLVVDELKEQRFPIWGILEDWQPYFDQWLNIYRIQEVQGEDGDPQYNWRWIWKRKGADHWALATVYARVGLDRFAQDLAQIISKGRGLLEGVPKGMSVYNNETSIEHGSFSLGNEVDF